MAINKSSENILEFSNLSEYVSHSDSNGVLRIWDSTSGVLRQEYVSSGHLICRCQCLAWGPASKSLINNTPKKKRKRNSTHETIESFQLVAMGTSTGSVLIYSVTKGDLYKTLTGGHEEKVVGVCWSEKGDNLYSCSSDGTIVCWDVERVCVVSKWTTDPGLSSICLSSTQNHLLTAGRAIQVWDIDSKTLLQTFQGHTTDVLKLIQISCSAPKVMNGGGVVHEDKLNDVKGSFVLSMAADENKISLRQIASPCKDLLASFTLPNQPIHFDIITPTKQFLQMVVVTKSGCLVYFECNLNSHRKKPLKPKMVTTIMTNNNHDNKSNKCLPILIAKLLEGPKRTGGGDDAAGSNVICILYGDVRRPAFDRINISDLRETLLRDDPSVCKVSVEESVVKIKRPTIDSDLLLLTSSCVTAVRKDGNDTPTPSKRRKKSFSLSQDEVTLGEQLSQMAKQQCIEIKSDAVPSTTHPSTTHPSTTHPSTTHPSTPFTTKPTTQSSILQSTLKRLTPLTFNAVTNLTSSTKTDSLAMLLGQGLQSNDKKILNNVLQKCDYDVLKSTVAKLPTQCIHPLVKELSRRISGHAQSGKSAVRWMKVLLTIHFSYLTTIRDIDELLEPLVSYLEPSMEVLTKMMTLKGKLDCMASQMTMLSAPTPTQSTSLDTPITIVDPVDEEDEDVEDVRYLEISDEDEWEDAVELVNKRKDSKSSHKTSDFSDTEASGEETLMEAD